MQYQFVIQQNYAYLKVYFNLVFSVYLLIRIATNYLIFALLYCHTLWSISSVFLTNYPSHLLAWGDRLFGREGCDFELYKISDLGPHSFATAGQDFIHLSAFIFAKGDT